MFDGTSRCLLMPEQGVMYIEAYRTTSKDARTIVLIIAWALLVTLRVQVPNHHIFAQNLYYNYYYPNPKYPIIGYMDPLGTRMNRLLGQAADTASQPEMVHSNLSRLKIIRV